MFKWIFVLLIAFGAYTHFSAPTESTETVANKPPAERLTEEAFCDTKGGEMVDGMGCVVGMPKGRLNADLSPSEVRAMCAAGARYDARLNACISAVPETDKQLSRQEIIAKACASEGLIFEAGACVPKKENLNPNVAPADVKELCRQEGMRYEASMNTCLSR